MCSQYLKIILWFYHLSMHYIGLAFQQTFSCPLFHIGELQIQGSCKKCCKVAASFFITLKRIQNTILLKLISSSQWPDLARRCSSQCLHVILGACPAGLPQRRQPQPTGPSTGPCLEGLELSWCPLHCGGTKSNDCLLHGDWQLNET